MILRSERAKSTPRDSPRRVARDANARWVCAVRASPIRMRSGRRVEVRHDLSDDGRSRRQPAVKALRTASCYPARREHRAPIGSETPWASARTGMSAGRPVCTLCKSVAVTIKGGGSIRWERQDAPDLHYMATPPAMRRRQWAGEKRVAKLQEQIDAISAKDRVAWV